MSKIILKHGSGTPPTLDTGEAGFDTTNHILYVGDGSTNTAIGDVDLSNINTELLTVGSYGSTPLYSDDWITIGGGGYKYLWTAKSLYQYEI